MQAIKKWATAPARWQTVLVCALLGAASFFVLFGLRPLDVGNEAWIWPGIPEGDVIQHYAGWMAYRHSDWGFPLAYTDALLWPGGTLIAYTDSIPLVALFLKLLSPLLPATFQFFGWFTLASFILQGAAAGLLLRLFARRPWQVYAATLLFTFSPILMERAFRHTALTAQWLVLFALYLYFQMRRDGYKKAPWQFVLLNVLAVGLHPYFMAMVMAILVVALAEYGMARKQLLRPLGAMGLNLAAALATAFLFGTVGWQGGSLSRGGYGLFSMNLNSPFNPASWWDYQWSRILPRFPVVEGQQDGFNYLGLGALLGLALCLGHFVVARMKGPAGQGSALRRLLGDGARFLRHRAPLLVMCLFLTLFAVSHVVAANSRTLFTLPLPEVLVSLGGIFRASGRMFWPVYYLVYLFVIRYLCRHFRPAAGSVLVAALVAAQLLDLTGAMAQKREDMAAPPVADNFATDPVLAQLAPGYECLIAVEDIAFEMFYPGMAMAAKHGLTTNIGVANTGAGEAARAAGAEAQQALLRGEMAEDTVYVARDPALVQAIKTALEGQAVEYYQRGEFCFIFPIS